MVPANLMKAGWWAQLAAELQARNRITEAHKNDQYSDAEVRRSVVYAREDVAGIFALLSGLNSQLWTVTGIAQVITVLVAIQTVLMAAACCRIFGLF
jgi:hypothetical protein